MTSRTRRLGIIGAGLAALGLVATACAGDTGETDAQGRPTVTYASFSGTTGLPAKFGQEKGLFKKAGVNVKFVKAEDPVAIVTSGDADVADNDTTSSLIAAGKGAPIKIVSSMYRSKGPYYLLADTDIADIKALKGKKVGINRKGSGLEASARTILKENGLAEGDVTFVPNGSHQAAYASLNNDQVDATIIHEPFVSQAEAEKKGKLLAKSWDYLPRFHTGVEIAGERFIKQNPEALKKFLDGYFRAAEYAKAHPDEYAEFAVEQTDVDVEVQKAALRREDPIWDNDPSVDLKRLTETQELQRGLGFQDKVYDPKDLVDTSQIPKTSAAG